MGERGVIVRSKDSGETWSTHILPIDCSLQSACFLTNQIGFVAGSTFDTLSRKYRGILLKTRDGGDSWSPPDGSRNSQSPGVSSTEVAVIDLPALEYVRFFDLENGIAIGCPAVPGGGSAVFRSNNGGLSWTQLASDVQSHHLISGSFLSVSDGIVVGHQASYAAVVANKVVSLAAPRNSLRRIHGSSLSQSGHAWVVGDGGFLLHSNNGGISWAPPDGSLSPQLGEVLDYYSVDQKNTNICIAGNPGGVILQSGDMGKTWSFRRLENPAPVHQVRFTGDTLAFAVGVFGAVSYTHLTLPTICSV